jgi:molecular chaperone DnaK
MSKIIGIDLGTSNSAAAVLLGDKPTIIPAAEGVSVGGKTTPSYVAFTKDGQMLVGEPARRQADLNPENTISAIKRKMGTREKVSIFGKEYTPQQISAFILQKIKKDAEAYLGEPVSKAVITVPAYFDNDQRQATKDAGEIAGLEVVRLVNEPTAASFAYSVDKKEESLKILVFDFGGGTLDVTIMDYGGGVFEVKSTSGDTNLGGTDMDIALMDYVTSRFNDDTGVDLKGNKEVYHRLKEATEKAKIELSTTLETQINLPFIAQDKSGQPVHLNMTITRAKLEQLVKPIIDKCKSPVERALGDAGLTPADIDKILMVGGPTRMPIVQKTVEDFLNKKIERGIDPMECVAMGAAIQAGVLSGDVEDVVLVDVTPLSLGIETMGGVFTKMIERNTPVPTKQTQVFSTAADNQTTVEVHILQGERPMANDNLSLGKFKLDGIPSAPRGVPQIEVTYEIDSNGILKVHAKDKATNKENSIRVEDASRLTKDEIDKMKDEADKYSEADKVRKEKIEMKNKADTLVYTTRKTLKDAEGKVDQTKLDEVKTLADEIEKSISDDKIDELKDKTEELQNKLNDIGQEMYKAEQANSQQQETADSEEEPNKSSDDEGPTVDGEGRATD